MTLNCKLVATEYDPLGYTTYVFKNLEKKIPFGHAYIMVTRWPNWQHRDLKLGEKGFLEYKEVQAGIDTWWDGEKFIPYNYSNIIFIKFIEEQKIDNSKKNVIQI